MGFDISKAQQVTRLYTRKSTAGQNYHLRYSEKTKRFQIANKVWDALNLIHNGFNVERDPSGSVAFTLVPEADATIFRRRNRKDGSVPGKNKLFSSPVLRNFLDAAGYKGINLFNLSEVGTDENGIRYFEIVPSNAQPSAQEEGETEGEDFEEASDTEATSETSTDDMFADVETATEGKDPFAI